MKEKKDKCMLCNKEEGTTDFTETLQLEIRLTRKHGRYICNICGDVIGEIAKERIKRQLY